MKKCIQFNEKENYGKYIDILDDLRQFSQNDMIRIIVALSLMCCKTYITTLMTLWLHFKRFFGCIQIKKMHLKCHNFKIIDVQSWWFVGSITCSRRHSSFIHDLDLKTRIFCSQYKSWRLKVMKRSQGNCCLPAGGVWRRVGGIRTPLLSRAGISAKKTEHRKWLLSLLLPVVFVPWTWPSII